MLNKSNYGSIRQSSDALADSRFNGRINYAPINELKLRPEGGETAFDTKKTQIPAAPFPLFGRDRYPDLQLAKSTRQK
jgi:hypothetical protein